MKLVSILVMCIIPLCAMAQGHGHGHGFGHGYGHQGFHQGFHRGFHGDNHEAGWYRSRFNTIRIINGGYYYFNNGCWYAAYGYDPYYNSYTVYQICRGEPGYIDVDID